MSYGRFANTQSDEGHSSAVASVLYSRGGTHPAEITKSGSYVFGGDASAYHECEFRTRLRIRAAGDDPKFYAEAMSKVVDGLRGEAFIVAKEIGLDKIWEPGHISHSGDPANNIKPGVDTLIEAIKASVFPQTTYEAKELFRQYTKPSGALARQAGESMHQYISRRQRCWKLLKELDPEIVLSEGHRADMLLDLSGLDKNERTMIQASIGNSRDFDKIAEALIVQHPRAHLKATSTPKSKGSGKPFFRRGGKGKFRPKGKGKGKHAYPAVEEFREEFDWDSLPQDCFYGNEEPPSEPAYMYEEDYDCYDDREEAAYAAQEAVNWSDDRHWRSHEEREWDSNCFGDYSSRMAVHEPIDDWNDFSAYVADGWRSAWSADNALESAELECVACIADVLGPDCWSDPATCADFIQNGATAFVASGKGEKGKGKGKYPVRPSNLSIEDRRKKLQELKAKTECKDCGRKGHWRGDKECTMTKTKTAHYSVQSHSSFVSVDEESDDEEAHLCVAFMAERSAPAARPKSSNPPVAR